MAKAYDEGFFNDMITPAFGLNTDNNLRRDTSLEKLASLKPAFDKQNGTLTAGNFYTIYRWSLCGLLASEEWAKANNLPILLHHFFRKLPGLNMLKISKLLLAPVFAADRMLKKAGMSLDF
jgi:acetyl-CoA C-acetyltransferase